MMKQSFLALVALAPFASGLIYDNVDDIGSLEFDYVVVGGSISTLAGITAHY